MSSGLRSSILSGAGFGLGALAGGTVYQSILIFYLGDFDPKFAGVPKLAFRLELASTALLALIGAMISMLAFVGWRRRAQRRLPSFQRGVVFAAALLGAPYVPLLSLVAELTEKGLGPETVLRPVIVSLLLVAYPLTAAVLARVLLVGRS